MKCPKCEADIKTGNVFCEKCGYEIQLVPDYDPLDELLIGKATSKSNTKVQEQYRVKAVEEEIGSTVSHELWYKKKRIWIPIGIILCMIISMGCYFFVSSGTNFTYQHRKGNAELKDENYQEALMHFSKALRISEETDLSPKFYCDFANVYAGLGKKTEVQLCIEKALLVETPTLETYLTCIDILNSVGKTSYIQKLIDTCTQGSIKKELIPYAIEKPSLDKEEGNYGFNIQVRVTAEYGSVFYTLDGTSPTIDSLEYVGPVLIDQEGATILTAVAINKQGIISEETVGIYNIDYNK